MKEFPTDIANRYNLLNSAVSMNETCLVEMKLRKTGDNVPVLCIIHNDKGAIRLLPVAQIFEGNPYDLVIPEALDPTILL